jgi:predicted  nucleic acid-binding Zn-ribbon protein
MEIEKTLKENNQKLNTIFDETITSKLEKLNKELSSELDEIQERGLSLLEEIEEVKEEITNAQNFLNGIDETIDEIKAEVFEKQGLENESEKHVQERISLILNDLPIDFQTRYLKLKKDSPHHNSLSVVKDKKCQFCHYEINSRKLEAIEIKFELHKCDMCKRILIPEQASY